MKHTGMAKILTALAVLFAVPALGFERNEYDRERDPQHALAPPEQRGVTTLGGQSCAIVGDLGGATISKTEKQVFLEEFLANQTDVTCWTPPTQTEPISVKKKDITIEQQKAWQERKQEQ